MICICNYCGKAFLTESNSHVVIPIRNYEVNCGCYFERLKESLIIYLVSIIVRHKDVELMKMMQKGINKEKFESMIIEEKRKLNWESLNGTNKYGR